MIPQSWIHIIIPLSKPTECTTPRVSPCVNYGLGMIMMHQCRLISCNNHITLGWDVASGRLCEWRRMRICRNSVLSTQFCCEPKTTLRINSIFEKKIIVLSITVLNLLMFSVQKITVSIIYIYDGRVNLAPVTSSQLEVKVSLFQHLCWSHF